MRISIIHEYTVIVFREFFLALPLALVVLELGPHSRWKSELLAGLGHEVLVANAGKVSLIHQSDRKNDRGMPATWPGFPHFLLPWR